MDSKQDVIASLQQATFELSQAHEAVVNAEDDKEHAISMALMAGLSWREIGLLLQQNHATAFKWYYHRRETM